MATLEPPFLDLYAATWVADDRYEMRSDARRFESWERNVAAVLGLGEAARYHREVGPTEAWDRIQALGAGLRGRLEELPRTTVHDRGEVLGGIVTFSVDGVPAGDLSQRLRDQRINTSVTALTSARYDLVPRGVEEQVRASVHYYNTEAELGALVAALGR
jgi:selenocysteine lyase/cysteine desulfurase